MQSKAWSIFSVAIKCQSDNCLADRKLFLFYHSFPQIDFIVWDSLSCFIFWDQKLPSEQFHLENAHLEQIQLLTCMPPLAYSVTI